MSAAIKDPICGMTVDPAAAISTTRAGETFYFCSQHCLDKFNSKSTEDKSCCHEETEPHSKKPTSAKYFCPMCEGVESDEPGDCP